MDSQLIAQSAKKYGDFMLRYHLDMKIRCVIAGIIGVPTSRFEGNPRSVFSSVAWSLLRFWNETNFKKTNR